jgi:hypothetical protein
MEDRSGPGCMPRYPEPQNRRPDRPSDPHQFWRSIKERPVAETSWARTGENADEGSTDR